MTSSTLPCMNGSPLHSKRGWMRQSVQRFFSDFNWENSSPEVQAWMQTTATGQQPLSLTLKVQQFFEAVNWDGSTIGSVGQIQVSQSAPVPIPPAPLETFTLDDFSDFF
jgi:hypothetical protein